MVFNVRVVSSYLPEVCGIATHTQDLITALSHLDIVDSIRVASIDKSKGENVYNFPVDLVIDQYNEDSWVKAAYAILEKTYVKYLPTVIVLQHEYGLSGVKAQGNDYQNIARLFKDGKNSITVANLHTVSERPDEHQKDVIKELSDLVDGMIVTTKSAIEILSREPYNIDPNKIKHIDHGIRIHDLTNVDQNQIKSKYKLDKKLIISTLGLKSEGKGIEYGIEAFGKMINKYFSSQNSSERKKIIYLIAGQYHPNFIKERPETYTAVERKIERAVKNNKLNSIKTHFLEDLSEKDINENDVVFLDNRLSEKELRELYLASDIILLPYRNRYQISSGILAEAVGSGKSVIATKFAHAKELLCPGNNVKKRVVGMNPQSRGILVDLIGKYKNIPSVKQMVNGLEYLVFNETARAQMSQNARSRGHEMNWENVTREFANHIS